MPTNPMLSAGHMGIVDALKYGVTRDYPTVAAALADIGSADRILLLAADGDNVWTMNTNLTIPANVTLQIPPGVHVNGTGNLTINGRLQSGSDTWYTGTGVVTLSTLPFAVGALFANTITTLKLGLNITTPVTQIHVSGDNVLPAALRLEERTAGQGGAAVQFYSAGTNRGAFGLPGTQNVTLSLANSANFVITGGGGLVGIGMTPTQQLELSTANAQKASGTTWLNPSDERLKTDITDFVDGLNVVLGMRPVRFRFNGLAGTDPEMEPQPSIIAQELQPHAPYMIHTYDAKLQETDAELTKLYNYDGTALPLILVNAVKDLVGQIAGLKDTITGMQEELTTLRYQMQEATLHATATRPKAEDRPPPPEAR